MTKLVKLPCKEQVDLYLKKWNTLEHYKANESATNKVFDLFPKNNKLEEILTKVCLVNAFYSTSIYDIFSVSKHILSLNIDKKLAKQDLTVANDIAKVEMKDKVRDFYSFATKYCCHSTNGLLPIYDSFVEKMLLQINKQEHFANFKRADLREYAKFNQVLADFQTHFKLDKYSLGEIDRYLWLAGKDEFPKNY